MGANHSSKKVENYSELFCLHNDKWCIVEVQYKRTLTQNNIETPTMTFYIEPNSSKTLPIDVRDINEITIYQNHVIIVHISNINKLKLFRIQ